MPETLLSAVCVILALIGLITVIYTLLARFLFSGSGKKILIVLPMDGDDDSDVVFAGLSIIRSYPLFSPKLIELAVCRKDEEHNIVNALEKDI